MTTALTTGLLAGIVAIIATLAVERLGGQLGGVVATVPTTIIPAALGIHAQSSAGAFQETISVVPLGILLNALFLWMWQLCPPRLPKLRPPLRLALMIGISLGAWLLAAAGALSAMRHSAACGVSPALWGGVSTLLLAALGLFATRRPVFSGGTARRVARPVLAARGAFAAAAVVAGVSLANAGLPLVSGIATVFPAIWLTTMVSLWLSHGERVQISAAGPMILGSLSIAVFAQIARFSMPTYGPIVGCGIAWIVAVATVSVPAARLLRKRVEREKIHTH